MFGFGKKKKQISFYELLENQARVTMEGISKFCDFCNEPTEELSKSIKNYEVDGDNARRLLISEINKTFITPIDREDLFRLSSDIDDVIDAAWATVMEMKLYKIAPDETMLKMGDMLRMMTIDLLSAVQHLEHNKDISNIDAVKVKKLENEFKTTYHTALAHLYDQDDFRIILKYKEVYHHLNGAAAKCDTVADTILNIIVKSN
ncbi:MAG: DUF47 family protein [Clostridia bacterium]|nr:DUF47 family protein [Clostridia bacterium]